MRAWSVVGLAWPGAHARLGTVYEQQQGSHGAQGPLWCFPCPAGPMSEEERRAVIKSEIAKVGAKRPHFERVAHFAMLQQPLSAEDGTLTRTFKPRRPAIFGRYAREVEEVLAKLR